MTLPAPLRLLIDLDALADNWRWFARRSGVETGAAVKADGYGLGAAAVATRLHAEGCRIFYVATWAEAAALGGLPGDARIKVLHGVQADEMTAALGGRADPVLSTPAQLALWRGGGGGKCDVMIDTGMNRLGLDWRTFRSDMLDGLDVDCLHSHLACADEPENMLNALQLQRFQSVSQAFAGVNRSLAGSGGACLGDRFAFDHIRPGLGLYGGVPGPAASGMLRQVVRPEARVVQVRRVPAGDSAGYGATWVAATESRLAVINAGYADGYLRGFSNRGAVIVDGIRAPVVGRVSMDLVIADVSAAPCPAEGDRVEIEYDLETAAAQSGLSQYELLTGLGSRYERIYT